MASPVRVLICGYYGFGNTGDEAILSVLLEDLSGTHPGAGVTVLAGSPADVYADHQVEAIQWQDTAATIAAARAADLMVLGGGGLFQDHHPFDPAQMWTPHHGDIGYWSGFALLARATDTPLAIYGVGVGPLNTADGRRYTALAFEIAEAASVRDATSARLVADLGVDARDIKVTADPAFRLNPASPDVALEMLGVSGITGDSLIGVCLRPWGDGSWISAVTQAVDELVERWDAQVVFVPFQESPWPHENDSQVALDVLGAMRHPERAAILRGGYTAAERAAVLGQCRLVLAMRLHSAIFGAAAGVPVMALAYDPKVDQVMQELGVEEAVADLKGADPGWLSQMALALDARSAELGPRLQGAARQLRERAAGNRGILQRALTGPGLSAGPRLPAGRGADREIVRIALNRAGEAAEIDQVRSRAAALEAEREAVASSRDRLADEYQRLVGSRALRLVNSYWRMRNSLRAIGRRGRAPAIEATEFQTLSDLRAKFTAQLDEILRAHPQVPGVVIYPHTIGWSVSLFQRPQQMALAFARQGYLTLYNVEWMGKDEIHGFSKVADRLYVFAIPDDLLDLMEAVPHPLVVSYVYNIGWRRFLRDPITIFEHIDELEVFTATHSLEALTGWYAEAMREADVVAASAVDLLASVQRDRPDAILCPNGVDFRHFAGAHPDTPPEDLAQVVAQGKPIVGYYGALAEWVDYDLIDYAARALPDHQFVLIGPDYDGSMTGTPAFDLPNVVWLGVKRYGDLPDYLHYCDVATVPFGLNEVTHSVSPLKLFEYMAGGRPVVTPALRECANYPAVLIAQDRDDYVAKLKEATRLRHDPSHQALLRRTARANTWDRRVGTLLDAVARSHSYPKG
ncbi:MAG TPA: polysaccharide pyruvyl transferase family protein [Acidimicrobiia bacterium]|nr:polysaccharide pyruvyl transferase family protein [Acidimicrobiia bacterium]